MKRVNESASVYPVEKTTKIEAASTSEAEAVLLHSDRTGAQNITLSHQQPIREDKGVPYVKKVL